MRDALKFQKALLAALLGGALIVAAPLSAAEAPRLADAAARQDKTAGASSHPRQGQRERGRSPTARPRCIGLSIGTTSKRRGF